MQHNTPTRWAAATVIALGLTACSSAAKPEVASLTNPATAASQLVTTTSAAPAPPTSSPLGSTPDADPAITSTASTNSTNATGSTVTAVAPTVSSVLGGTAPRERLDMTDDDRAALYQPYNQCLADNGVTSDDQLVAKQQADVVTQTCQPLYPLPPWEYDPNNPDARDFVDKVIDCLRTKGVKYVEAQVDPTATRIDIAFGGPDNDQDSITKGLQFLPDCEAEASTTKS